MHGCRPGHWEGSASFALSEMQSIWGFMSAARAPFMFALPKFGVQAKDLPRPLYPAECGPGSNDGPARNSLAEGEATSWQHR